MGEFSSRLSSLSPADREKLATRFSDTQVVKLRKAYEKDRSMKVVDCSVDFMSAGELYVVLVDAIISAAGKERYRSATMFFHGDALLSIIYLHDKNVSPAVVKQLEDITTSVVWKK